MILADTSAWVWSRREVHPELRRSFDDLLLAGEVATCDVVKLELLYGTRDGGEFAQRREELDHLHACPIGPAEWVRAIGVAGAIAHAAAAGHRAVRWADLLIAAAAESAGIELLHYDAHYELIGRVTGQPMRWLAPKGTLR